MEAEVQAENSMRILLKVVRSFIQMGLLLGIHTAHGQIPRRSDMNFVREDLAFSLTVSVLTIKIKDNDSN